MNSATRNRWVAAGALVVAAGALSLIAFGNIGETLVYYWSPGEMVAQGNKAYGPTIRLGGVVKPGTVQWNPEHTKLHFDVADSAEPEATFVRVSSEQIPPQMFREGIGVVVEGTFDRSQVFQTQRLMVNHSNEYRAPKDGENGDWRKSVDLASTTTPAEGKR